MKITYFVSAGTGDATRASIPLHLAANGSAEAGQESAVVLAGDAAELVSEERVATIEGVGLPPARELLAKVVEHAIPVYV